MTKRVFMLIFLLCFMSFSSLAQNFEARVSRTDVPYGETIVLILSYDGDNQNLSPDFSALKKDFMIFSKSQSQSTKIINGQKSSIFEWQLGLSPKQSGKIIIPSLSLGNLHTKPVTLNVFESTVDDKGNIINTRFTLTGEPEKKIAYVQEQINYTITLTDAGGLQGGNPEFVGNEQGDWIIKQIKNPEVNIENINGVNTRKIKFYYALFPQKSGTLMLPEVKFSGYYLENREPQKLADTIFGNGIFNVGVDVFDAFSMREPVLLSVKPVEMTIKPIASDFYDDWWLPAKNVQLSANWVEKTPKFKVGEAVQRIITLQATGTLDTQLPDLSIKQSADIKQYPDKPVSENDLDDNGNIIATKKLVNIYIPKKSGTIVVPELSVKWFNTLLNKVETAIIPAESIQVAPNAEIMEEESSFEEDTSKKADIVVQNTEIKSQSGEKMKYWTFIAIFVAFLVGIICSYIYFVRKYKISISKTAKITANDIEKYAQNKDFKELRDALILWGQQQYSDISLTDLNALSKRIKDLEFTGFIKIITNNLYGKTPIEWNDKKFIETFNRIRKHKKFAKSNDDNVLPELYKKDK